jgi:hypothetical protein
MILNFFKISFANNNNKPSLILIEFHKVIRVPLALSNAKKPRTNDKFKGVYVNKDMTKTVRIMERREEEAQCGVH